MLTRFKMISTFIVLLLTTTNLFAQNALEGYITEALKNNNGIKQQQFQFDRAFEALREARTLFLPSVTMLGSYTKAAGGRTIDLPIGDLFNPVYSTLNQLTQSNSFPKIENAAVQLNPDNFYDFKLRTAMPLINAEVYYNNKIKQQAITLQQAGVNVYKRALVKDVKAAYYQYYQSTQAIDIYKNALKLIDKNIAVNESLLRNGVRNSTALTRAQAEKQKLQAQLSQAEANSKNAAAYFNFLLNKNLNAPIVVDSTLSVPAGPIPADISADNTVERREELKQLSAKKDIYELNKKMEQSYIIPKLNTFVDLGAQGFDWKVQDKSKYYLFGVNLQWDLFAWGQHNAKVRQADISLNSANLEYGQAEQAFRLQLSQSLNNYNASLASYSSAQSQLTFAEKYYSDQLKAYKEGQLLYIELLDAQNQLTSSQLQVSVAYANVLIAQAETERNLATYTIN